MILPIGHEGTGVRRLPWVTFAIILINIVVFLFSNGAEKEIQKDLKDAAVKVVNYYMNHPYLKLDFIGPDSIDLRENREVLKRWAEMIHQVDVPDMETLDEEQAHLDSLIARLGEIRRQHPLWKYGLIPSDKNFRSILFHFFLHAGWLHLLGNLFFLYIMGPFLEDVWGRPIYAAFYILSGIFSGLMYTFHYPDFTGPLVGASGAISAVISAFLIRYWKVRIKFVYWIYFFIGTFTAPAWVMLVFEVTRELFYAYINDSLAGSGAGVAYWAHFWGLAFGITAALLVKKLQIEEKFVTPVIDDKLKFVDSDFSRLEHALELSANGQPAAAFETLSSISGSVWKLPEIGEEMWRIGSTLGREEEAAPVLLRAIENEIMKGRTEKALFFYLQLREKFPQMNVRDVSMKLKLLSRMVVEVNAGGSEELLMEIMNELSSDSPPGILLEACNIFYEFDKAFSTSISGPVLKKALGHPEIPEEKKVRIRAALDSHSFRK